MPSVQVKLDGRTTALFIVTVLMLAAALLACAVRISPQVYFDVDPRSPSGRQPVTSLGPAPQAWLHAGVVALAASGMALHLTLGGRVRWVSAVLVFAGAAACAWHMPARFDGMVRGGAWIAASMLALAALHLAEHAVVRRLIAAAAVAMLVAMAIKAGMYVFVEHPQTVAMFRRDEAQFLLGRGWSEGSPQHLLYVRRLEHPDAVGAFGLSNVFASVLAAFTLAAMAAAWCCRRHRGIVAACAGCIACGLLSLYLTHSKGAAVALIVVGGLLAMAFSRWRRGLPAAALACTLIPIAIVAVRGTMGPPADHTGERSLLFRYQYWKAVPAVVAEHPLVGVGPGGFKDAYLRAKDPLNPEDVTSVHNVWIDWIAMLGIGGIAWSLLLLLWIWRAGQCAAREPAPGSPLADTDAAMGLPARQTLAILAVATIVFGVQYVYELAQLLPETAIAWMVGVVAFVGIASLLASPALDPRWPRVALFGAAVAFVVHNQIEMTFYQESSAILAWFFVGAAAAGEFKVRRARAAWALPGVMAAAAIVLAAAYAAPVQRHQDKLARAVTLMQAPQTSVAAIQPLADAAAIMPRDPVPVQWQAQVILEHAPIRHDRDRALAMMDHAAQLLKDRIPPVGGDLGLMRMLAQVYAMQADLTGDAARWAQAIAWMQKLVERQPYGIQDRMMLADLWWKTGNHADAMAEYRRCLKLSDQSYLDPLRQLSDADRRLVRERLEE